jgi:hypothetical protein
VLVEENSRLKRLLIATVSLYFISGLAAYAGGKLLYDEKYLGFLLNHFWVSYLLLFFGLAWMPATVFLFIQGRNLKSKITLSGEMIDKSVVTLSITLPIVMAVVYIGTRIFYR